MFIAIVCASMFVTIDGDTGRSRMVQKETKEAKTQLQQGRRALKAGQSSANLVNVGIIGSFNKLTARGTS
jgi:hypothetical protein